MRRLVLAALLAALTACTDTPPPSITPSPAPTDPAGPSADIPYRPVMAGTVSHGVGARP